MGEQGRQPAAGFPVWGELCELSTCILTLLAHWRGFLCGGMLRTTKNTKGTKGTRGAIFEAAGVGTAKGIVKERA